MIGRHSTTMSPEQFDRHILAQIALFSKRAKAAGIHAD
jgi:hypothetical protein